MSTALLSFQHISFGYQRKKPPVIDRLEYSLKEGRISAILGPNGAGKTTLLNLALGWLTPWTGQILLSGSPMERISRRTLGRQVALVPQSEHIPFEYSVLDYVLLGRSPHLPTLGMPSAVDEQIAYGVLEKIGIADLHDHSVVELSGGERQMVLVARALAQEPRLLLLDEPTAHLDLSNKYRLVQIIKGLQEQGTTILMTTHDPELALAVSDESILMEKGSILSAGTTSVVATTENFSRIYRVPVRIVTVEGKSQVLWI
jgi:iron complex transport system ATP-binding protein